MQPLMMQLHLEYVLIKCKPTLSFNDLLFLRITNNNWKHVLLFNLCINQPNNKKRSNIIKSLLILAAAYNLTNSCAYFMFWMYNIRNLVVK